MALTQLKPWDSEWFIDHRFVIPEDCVSERMPGTSAFSWSRPARTSQAPSSSTGGGRAGATGSQDGGDTATEDGFEFVPDPHAKAKAKPQAKTKASAKAKNHPTNTNSQETGPRTATSKFWRNVVVTRPDSPVDTTASAMEFPNRRGAHAVFPNDWHRITGRG